MNITFDKFFKQQAYQILSSKVKSRECAFCEKVVTAKNFGGAAWVFDEFRLLHKNSTCVMAYAKYTNFIEGKALQDEKANH